MVGNPTYVDINIFVYWLGNHPIFGKTAYTWIKTIENSPRGKYVTSTLTLYQTLVIIAGLTGKNLKDKIFTAEVINAITHIKGLTIEPLKPEDFTKAVELTKEYRLDYEDSLHLAVALRTNAQEIISNDKDFDVTPIKRSM
ncbi:MAG: type II toxin-antitoxin system VapC family toxin [Candidatus Bathyarchaeia archaeon]